MIRAMNAAFIRNAIVLGLLTAIGPFAIDMYLPALPTIAGSLNTSARAAQTTLTIYFLTFGLCQLAYGPWSDAVGRKIPLYTGLVLFAASSIGCAFAPTVEWLIGLRALQGVGAAATAVIPRAIVRDLHSGNDATRLMALMMLVFSVSPILAPLIGGAITSLIGWRGIFPVVACLAFVSSLAVFGLPESHTPVTRSSAKRENVFRAFGTLMVDPRFIGPTMIGGFAMAAFAIFLAESSFVYKRQFGFSPTQFSLAFAFNAIGFIAGAQAAAALGRRLGAERVVVISALAFASLAIALTAVLSMFGTGLVTVMVGLLIVYVCVGVLAPTTMTLALTDQGARAGTAASLGGTIQIMLGASAIPVSTCIFDGSARSMATAIAACAVATAVASVTTLVLRRAISSA